MLFIMVKRLLFYVYGDVGVCFVFCVWDEGKYIKVRV